MKIISEFYLITLAIILIGIPISFYMYFHSKSARSPSQQSIPTISSSMETR